MDWTNPRGTGTTVDADVLEQAMASCLAWFARRGYTLDETSEEARYYVALWICPRVQWSAELKQLAVERDASYPFSVQVGAVGSGITEGEADDRREFSRDKLEEIDRTSSRTLRPHPRGDL